MWQLYSKRSKIDAGETLFDFYKNLEDPKGFIKHYRTRIFIYPNIKVIYLAIPKNGTSTMLPILRALEFQNYSVEWKNRGKANDCARSITDFGARSFCDILASGDWTKVCIVRDPALRVLSAYIDKIGLGTSLSTVKLPKAAERFGFVEGKGLSFERFLEGIASQKPTEMNNHWIRQVDLIAPKIIEWDFCFDLKNFDKKIREISERISKKTPVNFDSTVVKQNVSGAASYKHLFSSKAMDLINEIYYEDAEFCKEVEDGEFCLENI